MADFRKAGLDRGDLGAELKHHLISAKIKLEEYSSIIEDLEVDELEFDLLEHKGYFEKEIKPLCDQAMKIGVPSVVETAQELMKVYDQMFSLIEEEIRKRNS